METFQLLRHIGIRLWEIAYIPRLPSYAPPVDLWLVCHSKDFTTARLAAESVLRFSVNPISRVFFVSNSPAPPDWLPVDYVHFNEGELPGVADVNAILEGCAHRGWILQQILKYSGAHYSESFVVVDCDTVLLKPHLFFHGEETILRLAYEHSPHYRGVESALGIHANRLLSYTCHMMPFRGDVLRRLFSQITDLTGEPWYRFLALFARDQGMAIGEWDLYARFLVQAGYPHAHHPWLNKTIPFDPEATIGTLIKSHGKTRNSVSMHRNGPGLDLHRYAAD